MPITKDMKKLRERTDVASRKTRRQLVVWKSYGRTDFAKLYEIEGRSRAGGTHRKPVTGDWPVEYVRAFVEGMIAA